MIPLPWSRSLPCCVKNAENAAKVVRETVASMPTERSCKCGSALAHAILTDRKKIPAATRKKLKLILGKYLEVENNVCNQTQRR